MLILKHPRFKRGWTGIPPQNSGDFSQNSQKLSKTLHENSPFCQKTLTKGHFSTYFSQKLYTDGIIFPSAFFMP